MSLYDADSTFCSDLSGLSQLKNVGPFPLVHQFHFTVSNDIIVRLSRAIFEDFRNKVPILHEENFQTTIEGFLEFCDFGIKSLEQSFDNIRVDENSKQIFTQLFLERSAYDLILKLLNAEDAVNETENFDSFLTKLFCENLEFRRILILLKWSEEMAYRNPNGFAAMINEVKKFETLNNIYSTTLMRGKTVHIDSRFDPNVAREDQNNSLFLNQILFSLLRCGRLDEARCLVKDTGLSAIGSFIFLRDFLSNPQSTPIDSLHDNYNLAKSRAFCKLTARDLIPIDDTVASADQCIWATLSNCLSTLLSHATSTEDRLWAYASCGADSLLDDYLLNIHSKGNDDILLVKNELYDEDIPKTINEIFAQIRINENNLYFCLFGYLITSDWNGAVDYIQQYFDSKNDNEIQAHELRFLTHLVLLLKIKNFITNSQLCDFLLSKFSDLLIHLKLYSFVPGYLIHLTEEESKKKMLDFLQDLQNPNEQQEVLSFAQEAGFNISDLCYDIFYRFKEKNKIRADDDEVIILI